MLRNPAQYFIRKDVQQILIKLTGCDLNKMFKPAFNPTQKQSQIELLTDEQLNQENERTLKKASRLLQMPPFLNARTKSEAILSHDEQLDPLNFNDTNYVFTDISLNVPNKKRMVAVREPNGILRKADYDEREKMLQIYFPKNGKPNHTPKMFEQINLENCLKDKKYLIVLNKACLRYEPNDPEFIRITHRVYEYINEQKDYEILTSTRFFGPMLFYLAWFKKINNFVAFLLNSSRVDDCAEAIVLYRIVNDTKPSRVFSSNLEFVGEFIKNELKDNESSLLAFERLRTSMKANNKAAASN